MVTFAYVLEIALWHFSCKRESFKKHCSAPSLTYRQGNSHQANEIPLLLYSCSLERGRPVVRVWRRLPRLTQITKLRGVLGEWQAGVFSQSSPVWHRHQAKLWARVNNASQQLLLLDQAPDHGAFQPRFGDPSLRRESMAAAVSAHLLLWPHRHWLLESNLGPSWSQVRNSGQGFSSLKATSSSTKDWGLQLFYLQVYINTMK